MHPIDHCVICGQREFIDERCESCGWHRPPPASPALQIFDATLLGLFVGILLCLAVWLWSLRG